MVDGKPADVLSAGMSDEEFFELAMRDEDLVNEVMAVMEAYMDSGQIHRVSLAYLFGRILAGLNIPDEDIAVIFDETAEIRRVMQELGNFRAASD